MTSANERERCNRKRLRWRADKRECAVAREQSQISIDVVRGGNRVENEVETAGVLFHLVRISRDNDFIRTESKRIFRLASRSGEGDDVRSECIRKLHAHVTQAAETNNSDFLSLTGAPVP